MPEKHLIGCKDCGWQWYVKPGNNERECPNCNGQGKSFKDATLPLTPENNFLLARLSTLTNGARLGPILSRLFIILIAILEIMNLLKGEKK